MTSTQTTPNFVNRIGLSNYVPKNPFYLVGLISFWTLRIDGYGPKKRKHAAAWNSWLCRMGLEHSRDEVGSKSITVHSFQ